MTLEDFQRISDETPLLADLKPSGKYLMEDLHNIGGTPALLNFMMEHGLFDGMQITVTGKTHAENLRDLPGLDPGQPIVRSLSNPRKATGPIVILFGNLCP